MFHLILSRKTLLLVFLPTLLVSFQNCSQGEFHSLDTIELGSTSDGALSVVGTKITDPAASSFSQGTLILRGNCSSQVNVQVSGDVSAETSVLCTNSRFTASVTLSNGDGNKNIVIRQIDSRGNETVDSRSFVKDTLAPNTDILNVANGAAVKSSLAVSGVCETGLPVVVGVGTISQTLTCSAGMFNGSLNLSSLADGPLSLQISQTDLAGMATTRQRSITKDSVAPQMLITAPGTANQVVSPLSLSGSCETGRDVTLSGSGVASSLTVPCSGGAFSTLINLVSGAGARQVIATQTDAAGNSGSDTKTYQAQVPTVPPLAIAITGPAANTVAKDGVTLTGTCQTGITVDISGAGVQTTTATCTTGQFSKAILFSTGDGAKVISVKQTNTTSGATGTDLRSFVRDTVAPNLTIAMPAANAATQGSLTLTGACESGLNVSIAGTGVASSSTAVCNSGAYSSTVALSTGDGTKQVSVSQTDAAGNISTQARSFVKDNTAPAVTIASPAADTSAATGLTIAGACETGLNVVAAGTGLASSVTFQCASSAYSLSVIFSANDGAKQVEISQTDAAGNKGAVSRSFVRTTPPVVYDGVQIYTANCSSCHGALATSTKTGRTADQITFAINNNPSMNLNSALKALNAGQIQAISAALSGTTAPGTKQIQCVAGKIGSATDMRRLSKQEYSNTLKDLLGATVFADLQTSLSQLPEDSIINSVSDFRNEISSTHLQVFADLALSVANSVTKTDASLNALLSANSSCSNYTTVTTACVTDFINRFGLKVHRRPLAAADTTWYQGIYNSGSNNKEKFFTLLLVYLQVPEFLYHWEVGTAGSGTNSTFDITPYETVNRLSYMLWGTMPSDALFQKAAAGDVTDATKYAALVESMMQDARAKTRVTDFVSYWLKLNNGNVPNFPTLAAYLNGVNTSGLYTEMLREMNQFVLYEVFDAKKGYQDLMTSKVSFAKTSALASIYGHALSATPDNAQQQMAAGRKGLLMRGPLLAYGDTENHPIKRGARIRQRVLCDQLGEPPPGAAMANPETESLTYIQSMNTRERVTIKTGSSDCMGCHRSINPMGFALEEFDSLGRRSLLEKNFSRDDGSLLATHDVNPVVSPLDIDGVGTGSSASADDFANSVASSDKGPSCLSRQLFRFYKLQQESLTEDGCVLASMRDTMSGTSGSIYESMKKMVSDTNFRKKIVKP